MRQICALWDYAPSTYYYHSQRTESADLRAALETLATTWPTYGSRRLTALLRRAGWPVSRKRVRRVMRELGIQVKTKRKNWYTTQSGHAYRRYPNRLVDLVIERPDQVWVGDITYIRLHREFVYLAILMDVFTRCIRGWHLSRSMDLSLTLVALERALKEHRPEIHHSDQGLHYAAPTYVARLERQGIQLSMAEVGAAWQNGYAERVIRTIKEEEVDLSEYRDFDEAYAQLGHFLDEVYQRKRIHSSLGYLTPVEFEAQWRAQN